jgi:hypothetical protein
MPFASINPEVSWLRLLLEGMVGFPSPFVGLRTILWDWSHFSVGLHEVIYNPTEKQLVQFCCPYFYKKSCSCRDSNPGLLGEKPTPYQMTYWGLVVSDGIFWQFIFKIVNWTYRCWAGPAEATIIWVVKCLDWVLLGRTLLNWTA